MTDLLIYLLESQLLLAVLFGLYLILLRKETVFQFNRFFLLGIILIAVVFPLLELNLPAEKAPNPTISQIRDIRYEYYEALSAWVEQGNIPEPQAAVIAEPARAFRWIDFVSLVYWVGVAITMGKLFWAYFTLIRLKRRAETISLEDTEIVKLPFWVAPFSFFKYVFVHQEFLKSKDFSGVLAHEKVHLAQYHTLDLLFVQLVSAFCWFNPVIWQIHKFIKINHEYIADHEMLKRGYSLVEYQTLLLSQIVSNNSYGLVHHFNLSFIKNRITMMNIQKTGRAGIVKFAFASTMSLLIAVGLTYCSSKADLDTDQLTSETAISTQDENLVLPKSKIPVISNAYDPANALTVTVRKDEIYINQDRIAVDQFLDEILKQTPDETTVIRLMVDANQQMQLIRKVFDGLRETNRRKISFAFQDESGAVQELAMLLPPAKTADSNVLVPELTPEYIAEKGLDVLDVNSGKDTPEAALKAAYKLVMKHVQLELSNYVVRVVYQDEDRFEDYLNKALAVNAAFNQVYDERAQEMFGISFAEINAKRQSEPVLKEQYDQVRRGIPRAIWIH